eukprot:scaffold7306_cov31-Tisochrysis_lutea.AAC.3
MHEAHVRDQARRVSPLVNANALDEPTVWVIGIAPGLLAEHLPIDREVINGVRRQGSHDDSRSAACEPLPLEYAVAAVELIVILAESVVLHEEKSVFVESRLS